MSPLRAWAWAWAICVLAALVLSGCGSSVTSGEAAPLSAAASPSLTNSGSTAAPATTAPRSQADIMPCTDLTAADITAMGLDPATKNIDNISGQVHNHGCAWGNADTLVSFVGTDGTVALYNNPQKYAKVQLLTVAGLSAVATQLSDASGAGGPDKRGCYVVADVPGGGALGVQLTVRARAVNLNLDPCVPAVHLMEQAAPILLKQ